MASRPTPLRPGRFLPRDPRVDAPYRLTPQLVFRIGILGFLTLIVFAVLFVRLWALQVLSGNQFLVAAQNNQLRLLRLDAPRGPIEDRFGRVLVQIGFSGSRSRSTTRPSFITSDSLRML